MIIIGMDNGVTGSIAVLKEDGSVYYSSTPVKKCLNYTKTKAQWIHRIDTSQLETLLINELNLSLDGKGWTHNGNIKVYFERPMINPKRWVASMSAIRALEATLIVFERLQLAYEYIDSKTWQKTMLPANVHKEQLKMASKQVATRLFPSIDLSKRDDGDSLLIAEFGRRINKGGSK